MSSSFFFAASAASRAASSAAFSAAIAAAASSSAFLAASSASASAAAAAAASSSQGLRLPGTSSPYGSSPLNSYGYATSAPSVPMPTTHPTWHQPEHYIPITIAAVPKSEGTSHPTFQGGDHRPWSQPGSPIDGHGNRQHWSRKKP